MNVQLTLFPDSPQPIRRGNLALEPPRTNTPASMKRSEYIATRWDRPQRPLNSIEMLRYALCGAGTVHPQLGKWEAIRFTQLLIETLQSATKLTKARIVEIVLALWYEQRWLFDQRFDGPAALETAMSGSGLPVPSWQLQRVG